MVKLELPRMNESVLPSDEAAGQKKELVRKKRKLSTTMSFYIGGEILKVSGLVFLVLEVVHGSVFTIQAIREYGFDLFMILPLFWQTFAYALYHSIPISLLFGSSLVFGRLIADREVIAMRSFGISNRQLVMAPLIIGLVFTVSAYFINGYLVPEIRYAKRNLGQVFLDKLEYLGQGWNKRIQLGKKTTIHVSRYSNENLYDISIFSESTDNLGLGGMFKSSLDEQSHLSPEKKREIEGILSFPFIVHAQSGEIKRAKISPAEPNSVELQPEGAEGATGIELVLKGVTFFVDVSYIENAGSSKKEKSEGDKGVEFDPSEFDKLVQSNPWEGILNKHHFMKVTLERLPVQPRSRIKARVHKDMPNPMIREEIAKRRVRHLEWKNKPYPVRSDFETDKAYEEGVVAHEIMVKSSKRAYLSADSDYHRRLSYAGICFMFPLATCLLALVLNSTNRLLPFFIGVGICCAVFFPLEMQGRNLAKAWGGSWILAQAGNIGLLAVCFLVYLKLENKITFFWERPKKRPASSDPSAQNVAEESSDD